MNAISLDGYVIVKQDDLHALVHASQQPAVTDPARGADPPDSLMTVREAAHYLGVSPSSIHNYISSHQLTAIRLGRAVRIQPADLADFISAHRQNGKDPCTT